MNKTIRQEFADTMKEVGEKDPNLVVLVGDISHFILQPFSKSCPKRFYNIGICEPTMIGVAAGLSKLNFIPVIHTISPFLIERSFEQIKLDFGYQKLRGNLISVGSAFDNGDLGCTHHCYSDFALLKNVEGTEIIYPSSCKEFNLLFKQTYANKNLTYFRIPFSQHEVFFNEEQIKFGKGILVRKGNDFTIVVAGPQLKTTIEAASDLEKKGFDPEIIYIHTIKPLDYQLINESLFKTKKVIVIEEHSMYGGIFEDILRCSKNILGVKYSSINLGDKFVRNYGNYNSHCNELGFSKDNIIKKIEFELIN